MESYTPLTPAQREAIKACITTYQRVEFSGMTPSFWVFNGPVSEIRPDQFAHLPDTYEFVSARLGYEPGTYNAEVCVYFWLAD